MSLIEKARYVPTPSTRLPAARTFRSTSRSRACCTVNCCAAPVRMPASSASTPALPRKLPGVKAVLVPAEVPTRKFTPVYFVPANAGSMVQDMLIMSDTVRFAGQPAAAVAATSLRIAEQALELIEVEYEELPTVFDPEEAMQPGAPQLHEHAGKQRGGEPGDGFRRPGQGLCRSGSHLRRRL